MTSTTNRHSVYQTEKELKSESAREKGYPVLVHYENKNMIIEVKRTRKTIKQFENKFDGLRKYLK